MSKIVVKGPRVEPVFEDQPVAHHPGRQQKKNRAGHDENALPPLSAPRTETMHHNRKEREWEKLDIGLAENSKAKGDTAAPSIAIMPP